MINSIAPLWSSIRFSIDRNRFSRELSIESSKCVVGVTGSYLVVDAVFVETIDRRTDVAIVPIVVINDRRSAVTSRQISGTIFPSVVNHDRLS